jgi:HPt (histidine-containing phosphotransfer) domain-containing protein
MTNNTELDDLSSTHHIHGFDGSVINDLIDNDTALFKKFAQMFVDSFETALANIDGALLDGNRGVLRAMGHRAKTTARNIGAIALGDDCQKLEDIATTANVDEVTQVAVRLRPMFEAIRCELSRRIDPHKYGL